MVCVWAVVVVVLIGTGFYVVDARRMSLWSPPPSRVWVALAAAFAVAWVGARLRLTAGVRHALITACLGAIWFTCRAMPVGDAYHWRRLAQEGVVAWSEPGSTAVHALVCAMFGPAALEWIAPFVGLVATWCWLRVAGSLRGNGRGDGLALAVWIASGLSTVFASGYVEQTQLGVPFLLLACGGLWHYANSAGVLHARRSLAAGAAWLGLAAVMHGQNTVLAIGVPLIVVLVRGPCSRAAWRDLAVAVAAAGAAVGTVVAAIVATGFERRVGHLWGGADGSHFVPLVDAAGSLFGDPALLSRAHLGLVGLVLAFAAPAAPAACLALALSGRRALVEAGDGALAVLAAGYVGFTVWLNFDLGWPQDIDLMVTMAPPLLLLTVRALDARIANGPVLRAALAAAMVVFTVATWTLAGPVLRPVEIRLQQGNQPGAALFVGGIGSDHGPIRVAGTASGSLVELAIEGPPGAAFVVFEGEPRAGYSGFVYGGVIDLRLADRLLDTPRAGAGVLDANGRARLQYRVRSDGDGLLAVQAMVAQPEPGPVKVRFSAAAWFLGPD